MKRSFLTSSASTVASVLRLGDRVGLTPFAFKMSSLLRATICRQEDSTCALKGYSSIPKSDQSISLCTVLTKYL